MHQNRAIAPQEHNPAIATRQQTARTDATGYRPLALSPAAPSNKMASKAFAA